MKNAALILAFLIPIWLPAQDPGEDLIGWSGSRRLTWTDYQARPEENSDAAASTTTYLMVSYHFSEGDFSFRIESKFSRTRSWGLHKTPYILAHEQGHFDIAEIFARKFYKRLKEYRFNRKTYRQDLEKIYRDILDEKENIQNDYDRQTNHSINREQQMIWLRKIERWLEEYEDYAGYQD